MKLLNLLLSLTAATVAARTPNPKTDITFGCGPIYSVPWCTLSDFDEDGHSRTLLEDANIVGGSNSRNANCIGTATELNQCCKPNSFTVQREYNIFNNDYQKYTTDTLNRNRCLVKANTPPAA